MAKSTPPRDLNDIASFAISGASGDFVFRAGDAAKDVFIIEDGSIEILREHGGDLRQTAVLGTGDLFGASALRRDNTHEESARALTGYRLLRVDPASLSRVVQENPQIALGIVQRLSARLREHELKALSVASQPPTRPARQPAAAAAVSQPQEVPADTPALPRAAVLVHPATGAEFPLADTGDLSVGRIDRATGARPEIDLTDLDDQRSLSRRHAHVSHRDGGFYVREDTPTRNGTFVNGTRLTPKVAVKLKDGDQVKFGVIETIFQYR